MGHCVFEECDCEGEDEGGAVGVEDCGCEVGFCGGCGGEDKGGFELGGSEGGVRRGFMAFCGGGGGGVGGARALFCYAFCGRKDLFGVFFVGEDGGEGRRGGFGEDGGAGRLLEGCWILRCGGNTLSGMPPGGL